MTIYNLLTTINKLLKDKLSPIDSYLSASMPHRSLDKDSIIINTINKNKYHIILYKTTITIKRFKAMATGKRYMYCMYHTSFDLNNPNSIDNVIKFIYYEITHN